MTPRSISRSLCLLAAVLVPAAIGAQTGSIAGRVTDSTTSTGVSGATVQATSGATVAGRATAGEDGSYRILNVAPGTYDVSVRVIGYAERRVSGVVVTAGG